MGESRRERGGLGVCVCVCVPTHVVCVIRERGEEIMVGTRGR